MVLDCRFSKGGNLGMTLGTDLQHVRKTSKKICCLMESALRHDSCEQRQSGHVGLIFIDTLVTPRQTR